MKDISEGVKVVVCSMSSKKCIDVHDLIKSKCPSKKILIYTGQTDDRNKLDLLDVKTTWSSCDVLIYSPSIESGVNFDIEYFDKIYGGYLHAFNLSKGIFTNAFTCKKN